MRGDGGAATARRLPAEVYILGFMYRVAEPDGMVVFSEINGFSGRMFRFSFRKKAMCWYVSIEGTHDDVMVSHVLKAYELVCKAYGGDHSEAMS